MKRSALILALLVTVTAQAAWYVHLPTQRLTEALPNWCSGTSNPQLEHCLADGWRLLPARTPLAAGYRYGTFSAIQDPAEPVQCLETTPQINLADEAAAQAAAASNAAYQATLPQLSETGYEVGPEGVLVLPTLTNRIGVIMAVTDAGEWFSVGAHGSPWKLTKAERDALLLAGYAAQTNYSAQLEAFNVALYGLISALAVDSKIDAATKAAAVTAKLKYDVAKTNKPPKPEKPK